MPKEIFKDTIIMKIKELKKNQCLNYVTKYTWKFTQHLNNNAELNNLFYLYIRLINSNKHVYQDKIFKNGLILLKFNK
jgi:hypothetical protein